MREDEEHHTGVDVNAGDFQGHRRQFPISARDYEASSLVMSIDIRSVVDR
jgi:hypothetical protein